MTTPPSRHPFQANNAHALLQENAKEDEICVVLDSDDSSNGSEPSVAYFKAGRQIPTAISQKITMYEDLSCRDESESDFGSPRRIVAKGNAVSRKIQESVHEIQASAEFSSPNKSSASKEFLVSPVKAIERAKRTKIWEKASLYEKSSKADQQQPVLSSPRRKALPEALQPVLNVFEGRRMYQKDDAQRASVRDLIRGPVNSVEDDGSIIEVDDDDDSDSGHYDHRGSYRKPAGTLKSTLQKFEKLSQLAKKKKELQNQIGTLGRKAKRRGSAGNGTISGRTVEEKMQRIDAMFLLHHAVKGTEIGSLAEMQEQIKCAHREDFEKEVRAAKKKELLDRYETNVRMEKVQRKLRKEEELARQMMETSDLINKKVVKKSVQQAEVLSRKMSRRQTIARSMHVVTDLPQGYNKRDNATIMQLRHDYQRQSLGVADHLDYNASCGSLPAVLGNDHDDTSPLSIQTFVKRGNKSKWVPGLRPGITRGDSCGNGLDDSDGTDYEYRTDKSRNHRSHHVSGLRPGMTRGDSYGNGLDDSYERFAEDIDDEADSKQSKNRSHRVSGLRPGMTRGNSYGNGLDDSYEPFTEDVDEADHEQRKNRSHRVSGLRPGMTRGDSYGNGLDDSYQERAGNVDDEADDQQRKSRSHRVSGLRPGMTRGDSYGNGLDDSYQERAGNVDDETDDQQRKSRSRRVSGLRPGMTRGDSYGNGLHDSSKQVAADEYDEADHRQPKSRPTRALGLRPGMTREAYDEDESQQRKSRSHRVSGLRPGMTRGDSYGNGLNDTDQLAAEDYDEDESQQRKSRSHRVSGLRPGMARGNSYGDIHHIDDDVKPDMEDSASLKVDNPSANTSMDLTNASTAGSTDTSRASTFYASASELNKSSLYGSSAFCFSPSYNDSARSDDSSVVSRSSSDYSSDSDAANKKINALINKTSKYLSEHGKQAVPVRRVPISRSGDRDDKKQRKEQKKDKKKKHVKDKKSSRDDDTHKRRDRTKDKRREKKKISDI
ncbi:hypothetical protein FisN_13Hh008 [Fistulifera solaris]|uniref:Uncharacterized protein n=1 Tax=Fistulifera solaris TaxID=1519565 RepID=A0A1Z5KPK5_FISSO|nr:hypothetical protein FisN_13Hh008 [Fistulifera solaris]|eukprot:GAX27878.1 hypothetical protein FisN_13Hh008 [Fistulifera solaris]